MLCRSDEDDVDDTTFNQMLIVTQTPPASRSKHPQGDRTGDFQPRSKMSADLAKVINDGLYSYEQELWDEVDEDVLPVSGPVSALITQESFYIMVGNRRNRVIISLAMMESFCCLL